MSPPNPIAVHLHQVLARNHGDAAFYMDLARSYARLFVTSLHISTVRDIARMRECLRFCYKNGKLNCLCLIPSLNLLDREHVALIRLACANTPERDAAFINTTLQNALNEVETALSGYF